MKRLATLLSILIILISWQYNSDKKNEVNHPNTASSISNRRFDKLAKEIPKWLKEYNVPSASVAVIENGSIAWSGVFGSQDPNTPASDKTLYLTASIAKPVTAEVFLRLASQNKVSLDEPMSDYWLDPDIANDPRAKLLTPRHVLTHQTGFPNWRDSLLTFQYTPGTGFGYSGEGFQYLVRFVEKKLNRPFNDIAKELLFIPTGMNNSAMSHQEWYNGRLAWSYFKDGSWGEPPITAEAMGAGGMRTTSEDYTRFLISIMKKEGVSQELRNEQFRVTMNQHEVCLKNATVPEVCPKDIGFGLSWYIYEFEDETVIAHRGANWAEFTLATFTPEKKSGLVVFTNGSNGNHVIFKIAEFVGVHKDFIAIEKPKD